MKALFRVLIMLLATALIYLVVLNIIIYEEKEVVQTVIERFVSPETPQRTEAPPPDFSGIERPPLEKRESTDSSF